MRDARYLPCGHSFCRECLKMQPRTTPGGIKCSKCQKVHNLPAQGIDGLPVAYRINSIVAEIRSNDSETSGKSFDLSLTSLIGEHDDGQIIVSLQSYLFQYEEIV